MGFAWYRTRKIKEVLIVKKAIILASLILGSFSVNAELIKGDWVSKGDGKAMLDTFTGQEWLSLKETQGLSIEQVLADDKFNGWRIATSKEVTTLFKGVVTRALESGVEERFISGVDDGERYSASGYVDNSWTAKLVNYLGVTQLREQYDGDFLFRDAIGFTLDGDLARATDSEHTYSSGSYREQSLVSINYNGAYTSDKSIDYGGVFLVNSGGLTLSSLENEGYNIATRNVPAPLSIALLPFGLLALLRKFKV